MAKYLRLPVEVEAIQYKEGVTSWKDIEDFLGYDPAILHCSDTDWIVKERTQHSIYHNGDLSKFFVEVQ